MKLTASDGGLTLSATDYDSSAECVVDAEVKAPGNALVPGRLFAQIATSARIGSLHLQGPRLDVVAGRLRSSLTVLDLAEYPDLPPLPETTHEVDTLAFASAISRLAPLLDRDSGEANPGFMGVDITTDQASRDLVLRAGSRYALAEIRVPYKGTGDLAALPPLAGLSELMRGLPAGTLSLGADGSALALDLGVRTALLRMIATPMVDVTRVLGAVPPERLTVDGADLLDALKASAMFSDRVRLEVTRDSLTVSTYAPQGKGYAEADSEIPLPCEATADRTIVLALDKITPCLKVVDTGPVNLGYYSDHRQMVRITTENGGALSSLMAIDATRALAAAKGKAA